MEQSRFDEFCTTLARFIIGGFFVLSGLENLLNLFITAERLGLTGSLPLVIIAACFKIVFGGAIAFQYHTRYAAFGLGLYILATNFIIYGPQTWADNSLYEFIFSRNIAIIGGLLFVYASSPDYTKWTEDAFPSKKLRKLGVPEKPQKEGPPH